MTNDAQAFVTAAIETLDRLRGLATAEQVKIRRLQAQTRAMEGPVQAAIDRLEGARDALQAARSISDVHAAADTAAGAARFLDATMTAAAAVLTGEG